MQGFGRVRLNAALTSAAALLEMAGSAAALLLATGRPPAAGLLAMGWVTLVCQALLAAASLACIVALPPDEAKGRVQLLRATLGLSSREGTPFSSSDAGSGAADQQQQSDASEALLTAEDRAESALPLSRPAISCVSFVGPRRAAGQAAARVPWFDRATREFLRQASGSLPQGRSRCCLVCLPPVPAQLAPVLATLACLAGPPCYLAVNAGMASTCSCAHWCCSSRSSWPWLPPPGWAPLSWQVGGQNCGLCNLFHSSSEHAGSSRYPN